MAKQKYDIGQIVWYTGPDLVTYELGKTYTVLGYDTEFDMYEILSYLDDEAFLLPEEVLKPLTKEEEKTIKISDRMYEYYLDEETEVSSKDFSEIDEERLSAILEKAKDDIKNNHLKRKREEFANDSEYRIYLSDLAGEAYYFKIGIETMSQSLSERCLYINEFYPENIVKTDDSEEYDWGSEGRIYDGSWPVHDDDLRKHLGKATYSGYGGYPASCCWLLDKKSLLELTNAFSDVFYSFDASKMNKELYIVIWCYWD